MKVRFLGAGEYGLLDAIDGPHRVQLDPANTLVVGAFDDGRLVGRLVALNLPHIEAVWIAPEHRKGLLLGWMVRLMTCKLRSLGARISLAIGVDKTMEDYLDRLGYSKLGTIWKKEI